MTHNISERIFLLLAEEWPALHVGADTDAFFVAQFSATMVLAHLLGVMMAPVLVNDPVEYTRSLSELMDMIDKEAKKMVKMARAEEPQELPAHVPVQ